MRPATATTAATAAASAAGDQQHSQDPITETEAQSSTEAEGPIQGEATDATDTSATRTSDRRRRRIPIPAHLASSASSQMAPPASSHNSQVAPQSLQSSQGSQTVPSAPVVWCLPQRHSSSRPTHTPVPRVIDPSVRMSKRFYGLRRDWQHSWAIISLREASECEPCSAQPCYAQLAGQFPSSCQNHILAEHVRREDTGDSESTHDDIYSTSGVDQSRPLLALHQLPVGIAVPVLEGRCRVACTCLIEYLVFIATLHVTRWEPLFHASTCTLLSRLTSRIALATTWQEPVSICVGQPRSNSAHTLIAAAWLSFDRSSRDKWDYSLATAWLRSRCKETMQSLPLPPLFNLGGCQHELISMLALWALHRVERLTAQVCSHTLEGSLLMTQMQHERVSMWQLSSWLPYSHQSFDQREALLPLKHGRISTCLTRGQHGHISMTLLIPWQPCSLQNSGSRGCEYQVKHERISMSATRHRYRSLKAALLLKHARFSMMAPSTTRTYPSSSRRGVSELAEQKIRPHRAYTSLSVQLLLSSFLAGLLDKGTSWNVFRVFCVFPSSDPRCIPCSGSQLLVSHLLFLPASREREKSGSKTQPRRTRRLVHPMRPVRVGEASTPGPATPPDSPTDTPRSTAALPSSTPEPQPLHLTELRLAMTTGKTARLSCKWLPKAAAWKWKAQHQGEVLQHQGKESASAVLHAWLMRFDTHLTMDGVRTIENALADHPDLPTGPPDSVNRLEPASLSLPEPPVDRPTPGTPRLPGTPRIGRLPMTPLPQHQAPATQLPAAPPADTRGPLPTLERFTGVHNWLGQHISTQRRLPKSTLQMCDTACGHLHRLLADSAISPQERQILVTFALTMPRWAWPEPPRAPNTPLHAQARPRQVQERINCFMEGQWDTLVAHLQPQAGEPVEEPDVPPRSPGLLTAEDCRRLHQAGRQGRLAAAWRQLFSYGLASSNSRTAALVQDKWVPAPALPSSSTRPSPHRCGCQGTVDSG